MMNDKEFEMLLSEIPQATSFNLHHQQHHHHQHQNNHQRQHQHPHHGIHGSSSIERSHGMYGMFDDDDPSSLHNKYKPVSPVSGFTLQSDGSSSSLVSGWFSSDDGSPRPPMLEEIKPQNPFINTPYLNGLWSESKSPDSPLGKNALENLMNGMGRMNIREEMEDSSMNRRCQGGLQFSDCSPVSTEYGNVEENRVFGNYVNGFSDLRRVNRPSPMNPMCSNEERRLALLELHRIGQMGNLSGYCNSPGRYDSPFSGHTQYVDPVSFRRHLTTEENLSNLQLPPDACLGGNYYDMGTRAPYTAPSVTKPSTSNTYLYHQQSPMYCVGREGVPNLLGSHMTEPKMPLGMDTMLYNHPLYNGRTEATSLASFPGSSPVDGAVKLEAINCEDSIIIQGKGLHYVIKKRCDRSKEHKNETGFAHLKYKSPELGGRVCSRRIAAVNCETESNISMYSPLPLPLKYTSLLEIQDYIYFMAKDQHGCRYLQQKIDEGSPQDKQMIFQEIIDHVVELMVNPFGNYLVQKLLEKCSSEQRMKILLMATNPPGQLVRISLNMHGTRAVQKLINTLKTPEEKSVVISALEPWFLELIKDLNGNHVLQHCLQQLPNEENKFIFGAAAKLCFEIATHRHGCCVLQRCIACATGEDREFLISKICSNGLRLAQDAFGNYVIQFVLDLKIASANTTLMTQFKGNYVLLSTQKFSSNVIEKCLKVFGDEGRSIIIKEIISFSQLDKLLQDPYANYVIQSALRISKGALKDELVEAIRPYAALLRTNPYCKKIFSWTCLKQ